MIPYMAMDERETPLESNTPRIMHEVWVVPWSEFPIVLSHPHDPCVSANESSGNPNEARCHSRWLPSGLPFPSGAQAELRRRAKRGA